MFCPRIQESLLERCLSKTPGVVGVFLTYAHGSAFPSRLPRSHLRVHLLGGELNF